MSRLEERYLVIKISDLSGGDIVRLAEFMEEYGIEGCPGVFVEVDWPIYDKVVELVQSEENKQ